MATSLQVTMASLFPSASSLSTRRRSFCCAAKFPMPPLNPKDPFHSRLSRVAAEAPDRFISSPVDEEPFPHLDLFESPTLMAYPSQGNASAYRSPYHGGSRAPPPPDLPSILLDGRIVFIGMPLVPAVSELIMAQLIYLKDAPSDEPIYLYINSTGTSREDGERVANEGNAFAIYDFLLYMSDYFLIKTLCLGIAGGQAALLLSAGTKGHRFIMPHARAYLKQPEYPSTGLRPTSDVQIHANEVKYNRDTLVRLLAKHTGNTDEFVFNTLRKGHIMDARGAVEFGLVDKILRIKKNEEKEFGKFKTAEEWDRKAGIQVEDEYDDDLYKYI